MTRNVAYINMVMRSMHMKNRKKKISVFNIVAMLVIMIFALFCLAPFWLVLVNSITSEKIIVTEGYQLWPKAIDFSAYKVLLFNTDQVLRGYEQYCPYKYCCR